MFCELAAIGRFWQTIGILSEIEIGECVMEADGLVTIPENVIKAARLFPGDKLALEIKDREIHIRKISTTVSKDTEAQT